MGSFRVGTSGWSYKHWAGLFYPSEVKPARWLEFYATQFDCVELNASYYRLPQLKTVEGWAARSAPGFRFCPKLSRWITHQKKLNDAAEPLGAFLDVFAPLVGKLGPILIQLPKNLGFHPVAAEGFIQLLAKRVEFRFALEARHASWFSDAALDLLRSYRIGLVISQSGGAFPYLEAVTADIVYLRFHGPRDLYASDYDGKVLVEYADKIKRWLAEGRSVWAFFNNDGYAFAIKDSRQLRELVAR